MKKSLFIFVSLMILLSVGVFAATADNSISSDTKNYIDSFLEKGGIDKNKVNNVKEVNQQDLPDEVSIKDIEENKIGIYEVNYSDDAGEKKVFVVTYSTDNLAKEEVKTGIVQNLNFGIAGMHSSDSYLESANGVSTSGTSGYVMLRSGSITGISTSMDVNGDGKVEVKVYKNGKDTGFSNLISSGDNSKKDFDLQSENAVKFSTGDVISVYVESNGNVEWGNVITLVEITS